MPTAWSTWTDTDWLNGANDYHSIRLTADSWAALTPAKQLQALNSAKTLLSPWSDRPKYPEAVYEQALWMTSEDSKNAISDYSSVSVGTGSVSVSYGRGESSATGKPAWISPLAWALLQEAEQSSGTWTIGRVV
jgi:hypothetical protein